MKFKDLLVPLVCMGAMSTACTKFKAEHTSNPTVVNTQQIREAGKSPEETAENLALAGEQLLSPVSFMYADLVFDMALQTDASNKRAQFYKALIKPMMQLKGALNRIKPVIATLPEREQSQYQDYLAKAPESALKTFLMDGPQDIHTEEDALKFLDQYRSAWEDMRVFMKENKDLNLDVNVMTLVGVGSALDNAAKECQYSNSMNQEFTVADCDYLKALKINISRADIEVIQQLAAGMQIYHTLATAYSLDGVREFSENSQGKSMTTQEVVEHFSHSTKAGMLRNNALAKIPSLGTDAVAGARWALSIQDKLCPTGSFDHSNRKGFLVEAGLCIDKTDKQGKPVTDLLKTIESALTGGLMAVEGLAKDGSTIQAEIKPVAPLADPIQDLRSLAPTSYNQCGNAVALADKTIGGVFPNGDGNTYLKITGVLDSEKCD